MSAILASNSGLLWLLYLALGVVYVVIQPIHSQWYLARCRQSNRVEDPGLVSTVLDSFNRLNVLVLCLILLCLPIDTAINTTVDLSWYPISDEYTATVDACREWPIVMAFDLGLPDSEDSRRLEGHRTVLMDFLEYSELTDGEGPDTPLHILTTERYDCLTETLAKLVIAQREKETRSGAFLWGKLEWVPASIPGFDECYTCREGSYLLFRYGKVVALTGCSDLDLTTAQNLEIVRERILENSQ